MIIAQGGEAGGNGGWVSTMVLVPQVVDLAGATPVVAAGGIADGRGVAAALALGAQGVNLGTRFVASTELRVAEEWKQRLVAADALDAVKMINSERVLPRSTVPGGRPSPGLFAPRSSTSCGRIPTASTLPRSRSAWSRPCSPAAATNTCPSPASRWA